MLGVRGREGSIPVKGTSEGEELRTMNKKDLAKHWTLLLSYELSSQSEKIMICIQIGLESEKIDL